MASTDILTRNEKQINFEQDMVPSTLFKTGFNRSVYTGQLDTTVKEMYSIALLDINNNFSVLEVDDLDPHPKQKPKAEYFFTVPPKVLENNEPYTSKIVPTQNSGKYVESHGVLIRDIRLQGTTGLRPNKPLPASIKLLSGLPGPLVAPANSLAGPIINKIDQLGALVKPGDEGGVRGGLDPAERTGYDDIMFLRNIFRRYSDIKKNNLNASSIVMVWRNVKDADYWIVEPKAFKVSQDASSPLTYKYDITIRTLSRLEYTFTASPDPLQKLRDSQRFMARVQGNIREVTNTLLIVANSVDRLTAAGIFAQDLLMKPMIDVIRNTSAIVSAGNSIAPSWKNNWDTLSDSLFEALEVLQAEIAEFGADDPASSKQDSLVNALRASLRASNRARVEAFALETVDNRVNERKNRAAAAYKKALLGDTRAAAEPETGGSKSFIGNEQLGSGLCAAPIGFGDSIKSLASKLLGSRDRWQLLVLINDLRHPFISSAGGDKVLQPGDFILYPVNEPGGVSTAEINIDDLEKDQKGQNRDTAIERSYGRDIRLNSDSFNRTDIFVNEQGDMGTIVGIPNVKQAIRLKLSTEQGELTVHPRYGAKFPIGKKVTPISFNEFRINTFATIISDPRITSIKNLDFLARGDVLSVGAELLLNPLADTVTASFSVRNV